MKDSKKMVAIGLLAVFAVSGVAAYQNRGTVKAAARNLAVAVKLLPPATPPKEGVDRKILERSRSVVIGKQDARVTLVEFFDPACSSCRRYHPVVQEILNNHPDQVRVIIRYALFHKSSDEAARLLEAAREQGLYGPVLEAVLAVQPDWIRDKKAQAAWAAAVKAGLDEARARKVAGSAEIAELLEADTVDVEAVNVRGTPTFYVNGKLLKQLSEEALEAWVENEVKASEKVSI
ncbi:DsbA family protein [Neisseria wadsworthii]|nr:thioredoxin domain-containing protein [Neisseria wadsworthii]QMT35098.1 thioredoxin domain-containing protein [Neisseria wadsworthii]